jgi:hypothetical protein
LSLLPPKAGQIADRLLKAKGVNIHYNTSYDEEFKKNHTYDLVINCAG